MAAPMVEAECAVMYPAAKSAPEEMPPIETSFGEEERRGSGAGALVEHHRKHRRKHRHEFAAAVRAPHVARAAITALYIACVTYIVKLTAPNAALRVRIRARGWTVAAVLRIVQRE